MNILFVYPSQLRYGAKKFRSNILGKLILSYMSPPYLDFQSLNSVTPDKHTIEFVSEEYNDVDYDSEYDLIGITAGTQNAMRAYEIADEFRKRGPKVVLGGWHFSAIPEEAIQHADSVVVGEAEETWPQLLKDFENNNLKPIYRQSRPVDLSKIPIKKNDSLKKHGFNTFIQATRGCPFGCKYCSITNTDYWHVFRTRPIEYVIDELRTMPHKLVAFGDSSLTIDLKYTKQLFREMKELNKIFDCDGNIHMLSKDDELLKLASEAGCIQWKCGFETLNPKNIKEYCSKSKSPMNYKKTIEKINDYGMNVIGNFMFGFDNDTRDTFKTTLDVLYEWNLIVSNFFILTPFPGTPIYNQLEREKRIFHKDWSKYDMSNVVFQPKNMTPEELRNGLVSLYKEYYQTERSIKRSLNSFRVGFYPFIYGTWFNIYFSQVLRKSYH
jgi:radical SAM superfamily enzyme YgiQ (UPF0313 family)